MALSMSSLYAADFEVDGIYYNVLSLEDMTVEVTYPDGFNISMYASEHNTIYTGNMVIPSTVNYKGRTLTVTQIGQNAFLRSEISSITLPCTIKSVGLYGLAALHLNVVDFPEGIESIVCPTASQYPINELRIASSIKSINKIIDEGGECHKIIIEDGEGTFTWNRGGYVDLSNNNHLNYLYLGKNFELKSSSTKVEYNHVIERIDSIVVGNRVSSLTDIMICQPSYVKLLSETPPDLSADYLSTADYVNCEVVVPKGCYSIYKEHEVWGRFWILVEEGATQCASPVLSFIDNQLVFSSSTPNARFGYSIECLDENSGTSIGVSQLYASYRIATTAYAEGYYPSGTRRDILYWPNGTLSIDYGGYMNQHNTEKSAANKRHILVSMKENGIYIDGVLPGESIEAYSENGLQAGSAVADDCKVYLEVQPVNSKIALIKIAENEIKVTE